MGADNQKAEMDKDRQNSTGAYITAEYDVFPGISMTYQNSHTQSGEIAEKKQISNGVFAIFHCCEGRMECKIADSFCYISPGDLLIVNENQLSSSLYFPLKHYHGVIIRINTEKTPQCLSCLLSDVAVQPQKIKEKFCSSREYFIARSNSSVEHIFSELYHVPDEIRQGYFKIKILELMLFLSILDVRTDEAECRSLPPYQVSLAKTIAEYLTENMDEKITAKQAADKFHLSETAIKNAFKTVYGVPFYAYIKAQKMESAAYMLEYTDKTVIEIANEHGYDNASKFAVAFRKVKGLSLGEYRTKNG